MKIHLIKSREVSRELFTEVIALLKAVPGPFKFLHDADAIIDFEIDPIVKTIPDNKTFERKIVNDSMDYDLHRVYPFKREELSWGELFSICEVYRQQHQIPSNEMVLLLTEIANDSNWFSALDEDNKYNGFIHVSDWDHYIPCRTAFPVAYEVIAITLHHFMFDKYADLDGIVHNKAIGCINDMCDDKKDIILKLRTADICPKCMTLLRSKITDLYIRQAMGLMEKLRVSMLYSQGYRQYMELSKIELNKSLEIRLPGYDQMLVKLGPLPKALYIFFMKHPDGVYLSDLWRHEDEIYKIYETLMPRNDKEQWKESIRELVHTGKYNSCSEKLNTIRKEFRRLLSDDLSALYSIDKAADGKHKIAVLEKLANQ